MALGPMGLPHIFSSCHVDDAVPLQAVAKKVNIHYQHGEAGKGEQCQPRAGETAFSCLFHYDHERMTLGLPLQPKLADL